MQYSAFPFAIILYLVARLAARQKIRNPAAPAEPMTMEQLVLVSERGRGKASEEPLPHWTRDEAKPPYHLPGRLRRIGRASSTAR